MRRFASLTPEQEEEKRQLQLEIAGIDKLVEEKLALAQKVQKEVEELRERRTRCARSPVTDGPLMLCRRTDGVYEAPRKLIIIFDLNYMCPWPPQDPAGGQQAAVDLRPDAGDASSVFGEGTDPVTEC